jgi:solute carrier family 9 (sodium/hydrogen exchanger), member 8
MKEFLIESKKGDFDPSDPMVYVKVFGNFLYLSFTSVAIGSLCGFVGALMTKHFRFISHSAIGESSLIISFAMIGYFISEILELSGIVSLLMTAIVMSQYTFYNLSPQGRNTSTVIFSTLGYVAESSVFAYLGVSGVYYMVTQPICWSFIGSMLLIIIIGRALAIFISYYVFACFPGNDENIMTNK